MKVTIALPRGQWVYDTDDRLGSPGGFGEVFRGYAENGHVVAVKRLKISAAEAAHRELQMADHLMDRGLRHVLPFLDAGQDANSDSYFVIMPVAEKNLSAQLRDGGPLEEEAAVSVLLDIASGLTEVGNIVHRDLKPDNVLFHESVWKLADFGIARFVEESTSLRTLKDFLSPPYAAPEQWNCQSATAATDMYALGCIGFAILTGAPPFPGPAREDFRQQHLEQAPPNNLNCSAQLRSVLVMLLRKSPEARPTRARVIQILERIRSARHTKADVEGFGRLSQAGAVVAAEAAVAEATAARQEEERVRRQRLARAADDIFRKLRNDFFARLMEAAPAIVREDETRLRLGDAVLELRLNGSSEGYTAGAFHRSGWDVVLGGIVAVRQSKPTYVWSSSLWYTKLHPEDEYRWREVSYFASPFANSRPTYEPFALDDESQADEAAARGIGSWQIAFGPACIDDEEGAVFMERWSELYTKAVRRQLGHPGSLPLR